MESYSSSQATFFTCRAFDRHKYWIDLIGYQLGTGQKSFYKAFLESLKRWPLDPVDPGRAPACRSRKWFLSSIWERTAPCLMAFWVGRCVAATSVTATARPRRAIESAPLMASGASSASSAYSSMMITSGHVRRRFPYAPPGRREPGGPGLQDRHGVGEQRDRFLGVVASRPMADPIAQRLGSANASLSATADRGPVRGVLRPHLGDHPDRPLTQLRRIARSTSRDSIFLSQDGDARRPGPGADGIWSHRRP